MLDPTQEQELERLFNEALDLPESDRGPFVARTRDRDPLLGERLEALLAEDAAGTHEVFQREFPAIAGVPKVGPYRLLSVLGEGGMGTVFLAQQEEPVRRKVALKMIRAGMATETIVARFEAERETLARMEHSGIARMYFAGMTDDGRPYLAMEFVDGQPLGRYCREERCTLAERIELFGKVCDAVQYAHQQGIIHRDLKPTNVLVTTQDGKPQPKIIDFGIARTTAGSLISAVEETYPGGAPGTRAYMSPEQASGNRPVDTRSDIHALGVMLYEMLAGELPFDVRALAAQGLGELQRALVELDPPTPSKRFRALDPAVADQHAHERRTSARSLGEALQGDLDWITMRAMEKHPAQRYASASELKADLMRHLSDEPVMAGPPTTTYRVAKFVRRHRVGTVLTSLTVLSVLVAFAATLHSLQGTRRAAARERQLREELALRGLRNRAVAELFVYALPGDLALNSAMTVREMIEHAAQGLRERFAGRPEEEAAARYVLGTTFLRLGDVESAHEQFGKAYANQLTFESRADEAVFRTLARLVHTTYLLEGEEAVQRLREQCTELALGILERDDPRLGARLRKLVAGTAPTANEPSEASANELTAILAELARDSNATPAGVWLVATLAAERPEVAHLPADEGYLSELWDIAEGQMRHEQIESLTLRWFVARQQLSPPAASFQRASDEAAVLADEAARHLPPSHWLRVDADRIRGEALTGLGSFEEAETALVDAQRIAELHGTHPTFPLVKTRVALARLADAWQRADTEWIRGSFERWRTDAEAPAEERSGRARTDWWVVRTPGASSEVYAAASEWLLGDATRGVPGISVLQGMALVRSGDHAAGLEKLEGSDHPVAMAFGVLALRGLGRGAAADAALKELTDSLSATDGSALDPELAGYLAEAERGSRQP